MRAVVFDMDGILFDTERLCLEGWRAVARANGFTGVEEIFPKCVGLSEKDCKRVVTQDLGEDFDYSRFSQKVSSWMRQYIAEYGLPVMKGAEHLLEWLEAEEWKIGLASSTRYDSVVRHLERSGLRHYFSQLTTGDMVEHSKPRPDISHSHTYTCWPAAAWEWSRGRRMPLRIPPTVYAPRTAQG